MATYKLGYELAHAYSKTIHAYIGIGSAGGGGNFVDFKIRCHDIIGMYQNFERKYRRPRLKHLPTPMACRLLDKDCIRITIVLGCLHPCMLH